MSNKYEVILTTGSKWRTVVDAPSKELACAYALEETQDDENFWVVDEVKEITIDDYYKDKP